jgi:hypothetical protein
MPGYTYCPRCSIQVTVDGDTCAYCDEMDAVNGEALRELVVEEYGICPDGSETDEELRERARSTY